MVEWGRDCEPGTLPVTLVIPVPPASVGNSSRISMAGGWAETGRREPRRRARGHLRAGLKRSSGARERGMMPSVGGQRGLCTEEAPPRGRHPPTVCRSFSPLNSRRPVSTSCSTIPVAKISIRRSTSSWSQPGRHVRELALQGTALRSPRPAIRRRAHGDAEVEQLDRSLVGQHHVDGETSRWIIPRSSPSSPVRSWA
jgi:hypothetical protein